MNILIIEDDINKFKQIAKFLNNEFINIKVEHRQSFYSGLKGISSRTYELIILDMSLPTYEISSKERGGKIRTFAGRDILMEMDEQSIHTPVIVVTQFDRFGNPGSSKTLSELGDELEELEITSYRGIVYYSIGLSGWKENLRRKVEGIING